MTIRVAIEHRTTYTFARPVTVYPHTIRLRPAPHSRTPIDAYSLAILPRNHFVNWQQDPFGNYLARVVFNEPVSELDIDVDVVADLTSINPFDFFVEEYAEHFPFGYPAQLRADLDPYLRPVDEDADGSGPGPLVREWLAHNVPTTIGDEPPRIVDFLVALNQAVHRDVAYTVRMEPGVQSPDHTLAAALGSCRDSAWLLVSILRELGLAARFVSGYLVQLVADVAPVDGPAGPSADFTDLHAWAEAYIPGAGWVGLDATSGLFAGEGHIPLSATPHPSAAAPISGATEPVEVSFAFHNSVTRIHEDARVTLPYTPGQWEAIDALGEVLDRHLQAGDVRLTMGGEPTFVSAGDTSDPQWSTDADGEEKRRLATELAARLGRRYAPDGLVHHGQGKWYPGEPLPRWQIQLLWRADGQPLWRDQRLLGDPWGPPEERVATAAPGELARDLALSIATHLGVPADVCRPAYEDPWGTLWEEVRRPEGPRPEEDIDPADPQLANERDRAARVTDLDLTPGTPAGWVVPLFADPDGAGWGTTHWRLRRRHLFLTPGTSPLGLRLPLSSLAWSQAPDIPGISPFVERADLPEPSPEIEPARVLDIEDAPRHALAVEVRGGHVFVFLPPIPDAELGIALVGAIEAAAVRARVPVVLEGYPLPGDPRLGTLSVTPDPGVIEVNVQPSATWGQLRELTTSLYDDARQVHLATEKFDLDGTHTGTGGGNHFTLGGPSPADSPLLRRPDLLRSLITFWQHHPSLSYVFAGRFIGPTSQAPRVDEGRFETLYELEIAFAELERTTALARGESPAGHTPPWLVDRLLRHLLTDLVGNTHRAEFCIDKLFSPDSERGRLGLLEMRGFEMPPHAQMALVQALLVRALVARFWEEPYAAPLVRWGSRLQDRFLLPAFAAADLREVVGELNRWLARSAYGMGEQRPAFAENWLDPFLEFRFPRLGEAEIGGVHLELRQAIEPWHALGEEASSGGTARYVDSSVERVQVAASGLVEGRHVVTCNGVPVPLVPTGSGRLGGGATGIGDGPGTFVGGVRYRAWAPWSALHPTIGIHSPLVFDLIDRWNDRSLGGFTYHVTHPGGRSYDDFPVNAVAAESRRASRFERHGHTSGPVDTASWPATDSLLGPPGTEFPCTLDLRRFSPGNPPPPGQDGEP
ncbi:MAG: transglutaminase family protein [Tetrasphaera sp.]